MALPELTPEQRKRYQELVEEEAAERGQQPVPDQLHDQAARAVKAADQAHRETAAAAAHDITEAERLARELHREIRVNKQARLQRPPVRTSASPAAVPVHNLDDQLAQLRKKMGLPQPGTVPVEPAVVEEPTSPATPVEEEYPRRLIELPPQDTVQ